MASYITISNPYDEEDSIFYHNGKKYNLSCLFFLTKNIQPTDITVNKLKWILIYTNINQTRVKKASLKYPIIAIKENNKYIIVDGVHRLVKAIQSDKTTIKTKVINTDILNQCNINNKPYAETRKPKIIQLTNKKWLVKDQYGAISDEYNTKKQAERAKREWDEYYHYNT